ncbi:MAG: Magnesium and cobalt efflux protein CorC [Syntrophorhabdus sp. PtaB.Bin047]|jgi:putative hemolysin|nr:MAG: Magnesium and cobalt efflux protein CorC [Syntrophorhabdus sp. PtaB.Bin047]
MDDPLTGVIIIIVLLILNGVFSAAETAIVASRKSKIKELLRKRKDRKTEMLLNLKENPERFLSTVQIGITLFGTLASAVGGLMAVKYLMPVIARVEFLKPFAESIAVAIVVCILTYLFIVFGELVPKYLGLSYKERAALAVLPFFNMVSRVFSIFVNFLSVTTLFLVKTLNLSKGEDHIGEAEIKILLEEGRRKGVFDKTEEELINRVFHFSDRSVREVMVPRPNVYAIDVDDSRENIMNYIIGNEFSRYPVYRDNFDNVIGFVYQKDITRHIWRTQEPFELEKILKRPFFVPATMEVSVLLKQMQRTRRHLAVVIDEYGSAVGIITLEDIMEEIFGEIMDETDVDDKIERQRDGSYLIDASYSVRDLNDRLNLDLPESPDYETLGGFITTQLQGLAKGGEIIHHGRHRFTVVDIDSRRIVKVKFERVK